MAEAHIYIKGLSQAATDQEIFEYIDHKVKAGKVQGVVTCEEGKEFMVSFNSEDVADTVVTQLNGQSFKGDSLNVSKMANPSMFDGQNNKVEGEDSKLDDSESKVKGEVLVNSIDQKLLDVFGLMSKSKQASTLKVLSHIVGDNSSKPTDSVKYIRVDTPRLPTFSGDKGETKHSQWRSELECLRADKTLNQHSIWQAVRRSVKGAAAEVVSNMSTTSTLAQLIAKFDVRFGNAQTLEQLLQDFYTTGQQQSESVVNWGCRLEDMMSLIEKVGNFSPAASEEMLRGKFWSGLKSEYVRSALRHRFDCGDKLEVLIKKARVIEKEQSEKTSKSQSCQQNVSEDPIARKLDEILQQMRALDGRVQKIERHNNPPSTGVSRGGFSGEGRGTHWSGNQMAGPVHTQGGVPNFSRGEPSRFRGGSFRGGRFRGSNTGQSSQKCCYICGDPTHLSYGCPLNA